ncbi:MULTISPECIES: aquaporin Z [Cetobacterium]|jgi:aquaporin Z|uniref:Aquaporin Z n=1 Tax=Candidatus Cetobacterium colombiensis TaxID=3073100 RepID=A0ABU4W8W4_9FUSO|nr:aquaporin Z [Candidatus Cetobacterium colombiensis]MDX8334943.1 aquaporin Z [Candidatus Cetobacterium colombiensis]
MSRKLFAEFLGTFWLVLGGCGSAVLAAGYPELGIGFTGVALAFGLTVLTMAYAIGHISGCHLNPAVTIGLFTAGKFDKKEVIPYILSQVVGGFVGAVTLFFIASGSSSFILDNGFAVNGVAGLSPNGYSLTAGIICEIVLTMMFLFIILGSTSEKAPKGFAPISIGLGLTLIHLISIPVTNTSVNPARSTAVALLVGGEALSQLWIFWLAPIVGAVIAGVIYKLILDEK